MSHVLPNPRDISGQTGTSAKIVLSAECWVLGAEFNRQSQIANRKSAIYTARVANRLVKSFKVLIGMEIHVQLATRSKMFTGAANAFGAEPNTLVDEQVLGLPGVLPVMNKKAVDYAIKVGLALGCKIAKHTKWDRKSYYYPDLPKNYQIS